MVAGAFEVVLAGGRKRKTRKDGHNFVDTVGVAGAVDIGETMYTAACIVAVSKVKHQSRNRK